MATLNNNYSGLITKGLGLPASRGLITMHFHLFHVEIIPYPPTPIGNVGGGGGGGHIPVSMPTAHNFMPQQPLYYTPAGNFGITKGVQIKVKMKGKEKEWVKEFVISEGQAKPILKLINTFNKLNNDISEIINKIKVKFK